jgi:hypothetical protein
MLKLQISEEDYFTLKSLLYRICDYGSACGYTGYNPKCDHCPLFVERLQHMLNDGTLSFLPGDE